jgi:VanZ family protein
VFWRWLLVLIYAGCVFAVSAIPGDVLPAFGVSDKLLHATEFGVLALLLCRAISAHMPDHSQRFTMALGILLTVLYGAGDEAHQLLVAHRISDVADLAADGLGALVAGWGWLKAGARWPWLR